MLAKILPSRKRKPAEEPKVWVDLDRLVSEPFGFRLHGQWHTIKPMETETFFKVSNEIAALDDIRLQPKIDYADLVDRYTRLFLSVCDTLTEKDVLKMTAPQMAGLFQQILDCISGRAWKEEKKNPQVHQTPDLPGSGQRSS